MDSSPLGLSANAVASNALAADAASLNALKLKAGQDSKAAVKEAARQFESLFMRELVKSMRDATAKSGLMDQDPGSQLGHDLLDQQLAVQLTGMPRGLSEAIERQLSRQMDPVSTAAPSAAGTRASPGVSPDRLSRAYGQSATGQGVPVRAHQTDFVSRHNQAATRIAGESGIPASYMLGQAGHETGWGRHEIRNSDGSTSFNLFGIKAGAGWNGKVATVTTTEYVNGEARKVTARFRAYDSYEESFRDYARLIGSNPRYEKAMQATHSAQAFAAQLQKAGYATDPQYAVKLSKAISATQSAQRILQA
jgi:flagellar protein FlgJ